MVAAVHLLETLALEACRAVGEQRRAAQAGFVADAGELVLLRAGEVVGQLDLVGGEDVYREVAGGLEHGLAAGALVDAPQHQRRLQRHRVEAVGGHPDLLAGRAAGGDDGDAGGEVAEGAAEHSGVEAGCAGRGHCGLSGRGVWGLPAPAGWAAWRL
ncbi:hypothetical protein D3C86_1672000 [compost metagenome]